MDSTKNELTHNDPNDPNDPYVITKTVRSNDPSAPPSTLRLTTPTPELSLKTSSFNRIPRSPPVSTSPPPTPLPPPPNYHSSSTSMAALFSIKSAFSTLYHTHLTALKSAAGVLAVSVEYRLAPEHLIPSCYDDCWEALKWVEQTFDPWISARADLNCVFLAGDSAGANIAHNIAIRAGLEGVCPGVNIVGMALVHPYFEFDQTSILWKYICPGSSGVNDPRINPAADPGLLEKIMCEKVKVCVAGEDKHRERAWRYYETLKKSMWSGDVDIIETEGKGHVFHLTEPDCEESYTLITLLASFFNQNKK